MQVVPERTVPERARFVGGFPQTSLKGLDALWSEAVEV
jgi:hypothetical protein